MNDDPHGSTPSPRREARPWRSIIVTLILLVTVAAALWSWRTSRGGGPGYVPPGAIDVVAMTLAAAPAPVSLEALGDLRAVREVTLSSEVAGRVAGIAFESGQRVQADTILVQLDDSTEQADLAAARASAAFAQQRLTRATQLASSGTASREMLQQRQSERDQAAAQVVQLEARIRAPFAGELGLRRVNLGQYVNAGDAAVTLTDLDTLYVNFDVPQQELARLQVGQQVEVRSDLPGSATLSARINAIEPQVGRDTRNATVQATLANGARLLRPGMYVTVSVVLPAEPDALLLPTSAIITSASGDAAAVVRELSAEQVGTAEIVQITAGRRIGEQVLVTRGLQAGDVVVTEGQLRIQPGAQVRVVTKPPPPAAGPDAGAASAPAGGE